MDDPSNHKPKRWSNEKLPGVTIDIAFLQKTIERVIEQSRRPIEPDIWNPPCENCGDRSTFVMAFLPVKRCWKCSDVPDPKVE